MGCLRNYHCSCLRFAGSGWKYGMTRMSWVCLECRAAPDAVSQIITHRYVKTDPRKLLLKREGAPAKAIDPAVLTATRNQVRSSRAALQRKADAAAAAAALVAVATTDVAATPSAASASAAAPAQGQPAPSAVSAGEPVTRSNAQLARAALPPESVAAAALGVPGQLQQRVREGQRQTAVGDGEEIEYFVSFNNRSHQVWGSGRWSSCVCWM